MRTLYGLSQSPWTEKARWALDHHRVAYTYHEHVPVLGELLLQLKSRPHPGEKASVPLLVDDDDVLPTSLDIARHADRIGRGESLFPRELDAEIVEWAKLSDRIIGVGRAVVLDRLRGHREAQIEALPGFVPSALKSSFRFMSSTAASFLASKYGAPRDAGAEIETTLRPALEEVRRALVKKRAPGEGTDYLLGRFTFADVAIAASMRALRPEGRAAIGPATREIWTNEPVAADYEDLLLWRDVVYKKHRG